ncbi:MAG TPA: DsbA family protein [Solirubrobacteraceae bacterium]|nr:DsbA family protein [Solirubrobacteraceae bacterium]
MPRADRSLGSGRRARRRSALKAGTALIALLAATVALLAMAGVPEDEESLVHMRLDPLEQSRGRVDAPVTMVEFTDYQCPYCRRFQAQTWPLLKHRYIDTGKMRFIVRDFPLEFHSSAKPAAEAAHCAGEQGRFWPMHEALLRSDMKLDEASLAGEARALGLDLGHFRACVVQAKYAGAIERNAEEASALGVRGTPTFIVGRATAGSLDGERFSGALPYEDFAAVIDRLLAAQ